MKQRIITGIILGVAALLAILFLPTSLFSLLLFLISVIGLFEWSNLLKLSGMQKGVYIGVGSITLLLVVGALLLGNRETDQIVGGLALFVRSNPLLFGLLLLMSLFWLMMPFILSIYARRPLSFLTNREFLFVVSILSLAALMITLTVLQQGLILLLYLILLVIIADSGAYFVGRKFGKRKLAVTISPGKSVEGAIGGIVLAGLFSLAAILYFTSDETAIFIAQERMMLILNFVSLSLLVVIISISGDLFESVVKRHAGMKDSGNILPGHGGVLDRIDALTAAAPLFFVGLGFI